MEPAAASTARAHSPAAVTGSAGLACTAGDAGGVASGVRVRAAPVAAGADSRPVHLGGGAIACVGARPGLAGGRAGRRRDATWMEIHRYRAARVIAAVAVAVRVDGKAPI